MQHQPVAELTELEHLRQQVAELKAENARLRSTQGSSPPRPEQAPDDPDRDLILESATGYAILTIDAKGLITSWNEGAQLVHGWSAAEVLGPQTRLIFTPEDQVAG